ncbi:hypothetical protein K523DRAFT_372105 [Schizophyllum commune Tattone D]|nr:hypothetical protein K523DRAFT_372105 [Schizophyllum commune Tattone D]
MSLTNLCSDDDSTLMSLPPTTNDAEPGPSTHFAAPSMQDPSAHAYLQEYLHILIGYLCMYAEDYRIAMRAGREHWMQSGEDAVVGGVFELMQDSAQTTLRREFKDTILPDLLALLRSLGPLAPTVSRMDAAIEAWVKEEWRTKEPAVRYATCRNFGASEADMHGIGFTLWLDGLL